MGEIAEMMLDGTIDCETGEYLGEGHGYPRSAKSFARDPLACAYGEEDRRKPKGRMGRATKNLFANLYRAWCRGEKTFTGGKTGAEGPFYSLLNRGLIERVGRADKYQFTKQGLNLAQQMFCHHASYMKGKGNE